MSENEQQETPETPGEQDYMLATWVSFANKGQLSLSITLQVHGMLISGDLIGISEYFSLQGELFAQNLPKDQSQVWSQRFAELAETMKQNIATEGGDAPPPMHVHLRNAQILHANGELIPQRQDLLWRGRLASVDAWWIGRLSKSRS